MDRTENDIVNPTHSSADVVCQPVQAPGRWSNLATRGATSCWGKGAARSTSWRYGRPPGAQPDRSAEHVADPEAEQSACSSAGYRHVDRRRQCVFPDARRARRVRPGHRRVDNAGIARAKANGTKSGKAIGRPVLKTKKLDAARVAPSPGSEHPRRRWRLASASVGGGNVVADYGGLIVRKPS